MKRIITRRSFLFLFLSLFFLWGCGTSPPINHSPTITSSAVTSATVNIAYTYDVNATDPDGDPLTYTLTTSPTGMAINSATGVISWTPSSAQMGDNNVTVEVTDGEFMDSQSFIVTSQLTAGVLTSITVLPETMTLLVGASQTITSITASYDSGPDATIALNNSGCAYSSNTISVATVALGVVTGVAAGSATITVSYTKGAITRTDTIGVTVTMTAGPVHNFTQDTTYTTIQAALNAAKSGDTIDVANGIYNESITFPSSKLVILRSVNGASYTFIIGVNGSNTVTCNNSLQGTNLAGFNISHKIGVSGAGVSNNNGTITITGCVIGGNSAPQPGGGIRNYHGTLNITGSNISGNSAVTSGGGILNDNGTLTIIGNSIISNNSTTYGGGICNYYGTSTITGGSIISENSAATGGGIFNDHGTLTVTGGSTVSENSSTYSGGGIYNDDGTVTITGATVSENSASTFGGGVCNSDGTLTINGGSTISENSAASEGGGICDFTGTLIITGSTISENSAAIDGGGINMYPEASPTHIIGGSSGTDTANFNSFINNKKGNTISPAQHIRSDNSGDIHGNYPYNYYTPG